MNDYAISRLILAWAKATFGAVADDPIERAARMFEEATELAQGVGVPSDMLHKIVERTYSRPADTPFKEVGGLLVTVYALCARLQINPMHALETEVQRILDKDPGIWRDKHNDKVDAGTSTARAS